MRRSLFPLGIAGAILTVVVVSSEVDQIIAIRGLYAVFGLLLGAFVYYNFDDLGAAGRTAPKRLRWAGKGVYITTVVAVGVASVIEARLLPLILLLPVGYGLLFVQIRAGQSPSVVIPQIVALFSVSPVTKYVNSGFYFGGGDLLFHVHHISQIITNGTTAAMRGYLNVYDKFPGLHVLSSSAALVANVSPYDALLVTGLIVYSFMMLPLFYLFSKILFADSRLRICIIIGASVLYPIVYHVTYFFPQSLGIVLLMFTLFVIYRTSENSRTDRRIWIGLSLLFTTSVIFSHHLSFLLLTPFIIFLSISMTIKNTVSGDDGSLHLAKPRFLPLMAGWMTAVAYWTLESRSYIYAQAVWFRKIINQMTFAESGSTSGTTSVTTYGTIIDDPTVFQALAELLSVNTLYMIMLTAVFALGLVTILERYRYFRKSVAFIILGCLSTVIVFKTPFLIPGLTRIRLPFAFFFAFPLGVGMYRLVQSSTSSSRLRFVPILVFLVLAVSSPLYIGASRDLTELHDSSFSPPASQVSFSEQEHAALSGAAKYTNSYNRTVETLWIDKLALKMLGSETVGSAYHGNSGIAADSGLLLYRTQWTNHVVFIEEPEWQKLVLGDGWLDRNVKQSNKVYASGSVGLLWDDRIVRLNQQPESVEPQR